MTDYAPSDVAAADQHYARVAEHLEALVTVFRQHPQGRAQALDYLVGTLSCPHLADGTAVSHRDHVATIANLLALAVDRLAAR